MNSLAIANITIDVEKSKLIELSIKLRRIKYDVFRMYDAHHFDSDEWIFYDVIENIDTILWVFQNFNNYDTSGRFFEVMIAQCRQIEQWHKRLSVNWEILHDGLKSFRTIVPTGTFEKSALSKNHVDARESAWVNLIETTPSNEAFLRLRKEFAQFLWQDIAQFSQSIRNTIHNITTSETRWSLKMEDTETQKAIHKILSNDRATWISEILRQDLRERYSNNASNDDHYQTSGASLPDSLSNGQTVSCSVSGYTSFEILSIKATSAKFHMLEVMSTSLQWEKRKWTFQCEISKFLPGEQVRIVTPWTHHIPSISVLNIHSISYKDKAPQPSNKSANSSKFTDKMRNLWGKLRSWLRDL